MKCSICGDEIGVEPLSGWAHGSNAQPVNDGRCCQLCDEMVVIPMRIRQMLVARKKEKQGS